MRDITDNTLRRIAARLGYTGKHVPLRIAEVLLHPNHPGVCTVLRYNDETRRKAAARLEWWAAREGGQ
jgi:hypothetical protein